MEGGGVGWERRRGPRGGRGGRRGGGRGDGDGFEAEEALKDEVAYGGFLGVMRVNGLLERVDEGWEGGEGLENGIEKTGVP